MTTIRELQESDNSEFRKLWTSALTEQADFFRTSIDDNPEPNIPTTFDTGSFTLGAFNEKELVGILSLQQDSKAKLQHKALIFGMYVKPDTASKGLGKALLNKAILRAKSIHAIRQLYLTVLASNERAQNLYKLFGFEVFANEPQSVKINGTYIDEQQMVLFI